MSDWALLPWLWRWPQNLLWALSAWCLFAAAMGFLAGCHGLPVRYDYPNLPSGLRVEIHDQTRVNRLCRVKGEQRSNIGHVIMNGDDFAGCFIRPARIVVSAWYPTVIYHELCHASGRSNAECAEVRW